ncbi:MAG TPA: very short patch repair endonuclease [Phycisphaerae bacterium]|nr:very short patch repair endonuclease [Phycisphaerae bacterium]
MADVLTDEQRRYCMSRIKGKDTKPEMVVRRLVHALGYRFRLHRRDLPGCPDLVLPRHRKVIFVHGCFWHRHRCRYGRPMPATRRQFWKKKFEGNKQRDARNRRALRRLGWDVLVVWECQTRKPDKLIDRLVAFLEG